VAPFLLILFLNNSEIRYKKGYVFSWQGYVRTLHTLCAYATRILCLFRRC